MSTNPFKRLLALIPAPPRQVGDVVAIADGVATIALPGGGQIRALGVAAVADRVFVRDGVIEGPAPDLPVEVIEL
jgi:hypothetical protein